MLVWRVSLALGAAVNGCTPYDPDLGPQPFLCGVGSPRCPDGYACVERAPSPAVCLRDEVAADAGDNTILQCGADATLEPNETIEMATAVPIPEAGETHMLAAVICPETDRDIYRLNVDATGKNARVEVAYDSRRGPLTVELLNSIGVSMRTATPINGDTNALRADFENLATGLYYARVTSMDFRANYEISLTITAAPLPP